MIGILDASAALTIVLNKPEASTFIEILETSEWIIAPDIFIPETTNIFWKYHHFEDLPIAYCEEMLDKTVHLVDDFLNSKALYNEAFALSCLVGHPVYDVLYMIAARRHNGTLLTADKDLKKIAQKQSIKTV